MTDRDHIWQVRVRHVQGWHDAGIVRGLTQAVALAKAQRVLGPTAEVRHGCHFGWANSEEQISDGRTVTNQTA